MFSTKIGRDVGMVPSDQVAAWKIQLAEKV